MGDKGRKDKIKQEKQQKIAHKKKLQSNELGKFHGGSHQSTNPVHEPGSQMDFLK